MAQGVAQRVIDLVVEALDVTPAGKLARSDA